MTVASFQAQYNGLLIGDGTSYDIVAMRGLIGPGQVRVSDILRPIDHGAFVNGGDYAPVRHVEIDIQVEGSSDAAFASNVDALLQAFAPQQAEQPFTFQLPGSSNGNRLVNGRPRATTAAVDVNYKFRLPTFTVVLECTDPRIYDANTQNVTLQLAAASGGLAFGTNLNQLSIDGATFANSLGLWGATGNCSVAQSTAQVEQGTHSMAMTSTAGGTMFAEYGSVGPSFGQVPVQASSTYTAIAGFRAATSTRSCQVAIRWYDGNKTNLNADSIGTAVTDSTTGWTQAVVTALAPSTAAFADIYVIVQSTGAGGEVHYVGEASFAPGSSTTWTAPNTVTGGLTFPLSFGSAVGGAQVLTNGGAFETRPIITMNGPLMNPKISNLTTGMFSLFNITLGSADVLTIDYLNRTVVLNNSASRYFTLDPSSTWWSLIPGANTVQLSASTGTGVALVSFASAWI